jgi:TolA-binding protein
MVRTAVFVTAVLMLAAPLQAQRRAPARPVADAQASPELALLRDAAARESAGELDAAVAIVRDVLEANPRSLTALLAYERLLGLQGRLTQLRPAVDRLLELDPTSVIGHQMRLRLHHALNDPARIESAVRAWVAVAPHLETPYREGAAIWRQRGEPARAVALLEQGRRRIDMPDALALELGDAHAAAGDPARAAQEWARAVGADGRGLMLVQRRLQQLQDGGAAVIPLLVERLSSVPVTPARHKAAVLLAVDAGLERQAERLARDLLGIVRIQEREPLLVELARRADGAGLLRMAGWAYAELLRELAEPAAALAIRTRIAELALATGDTALAADTYRQLEDAAAAGSPQRRQARALRIQLTAREGDLAAATGEYRLFRAEYPQAPELDATAYALAQQHLERGDAAAAEATLAGVAGPLASRTRGLLLMRRGDIERAREELLGAAPQLRGAEATETIALAALLVRLSAPAAELVARVTAAHETERAAAIHTAAAQAGALPAAERSSVLDFLAASADRSGLADDADGMRRRILAETPRTQEAPAALLALALRAASAPGAHEEARVLFERLILEYPRSALVPRARAELQRLGRAASH